MTAAVPALLARLLTAPAAAAEDQATDGPPFAFAHPAGRFEILSYPPPPPRSLPREDRVCAVRLKWTGAALSAHDAGCPEAVAPEVLYTVESWRAEGPDTAVDLGEIWFVYPSDRPGAPRVLVRQASGQRLTLPHGVDAVPFAIRAWSFLRYPAEVHRDGLPDVTCTVHVEADARGYPTAVEAEGCDEPYRGAALSAIRAWRFAPVQVEGGDIGTALTLTATFVSAAPEPIETYRPSDESARLWATRQFEAMSKDDRIWFIRAALIGPMEWDLGPGQVRVTLPPAPDLGGREPPAFFTEDFRPPPRPLPDHGPILRLGEPDRVEIEVYELTLPPSPVSGPARCPVLVQVDGERQVFSWAESGCDDRVRATSLQAADGWLLRHAGSQDHATRHRFRAAFHYDRDETRLVLPAEAVRTALDALPPGVHTFREPRPIHRPPPRIPSGGPMPEGECVLEVEVSDRGRPEAVAAADCPDAVAPIAARAVRKWRWAPAEEDGVPARATTRVTIHFRP